MNKTTFYLTIPAIGALFGCTQEKQKEQSRPNIIYIMADDHAYQAISAYEDDLVQTPNIDRLAEEGILFENSFVTNSISAPSRAVLLTGKHCHINGKINNKNTFDVSQQTFPKLLRQNGYKTALVGKWHLKTHPHEEDFDYWRILPGQGDYYNPEFINMDGSKEIDTGYVTNITTDMAIDWMDQQEGDEPFCLMIHHKAPHRNWMPDLKHLKKFANDTFPIPETFFDDYEGRVAAQEQEQSILHDMIITWDLKMTGCQDTIGPEWSVSKWKNLLDRLTTEQYETFTSHYDSIKEEFVSKEWSRRELARWKYQRYMRDYLRTIVSIDENMGRLLDYLKENGMDENTVVIYSSDQGFYLGEHGWFDKRFMYEESLGTPLLIRYPEMIKPGTRSKAMVQNLDYAPTILDIAQVDIPDDIQGRSLIPLFEGQTPDDWRESVYYHYYEYPSVHMVKRHYGVRTERYKLIHFYYDIDAWEFYDLKNDPAELQNQIDNPKYADEIERLKQELQRLREKYGDSDELTEKYLENVK